MTVADEAELLELVVANSRIGEWVERIRVRGNPARQKQALLHLKQVVQRRSSYAEEARQAGVVPVLTRLLGLTEDEEVLDASSAIIAACSGPLATAGKVSAFTYDDAVVHIREGALGDGLGAKVWLVAHMLCVELASNRRLLAGHRVLELGSGCGVCGLAAAALGAGHVVLTDVEAPVLRNLRACMHLNNNSNGSSNKASIGADAALGGPCGCDSPTLPTGAEMFEEAEEVEGAGCDDLMEGVEDDVGGGRCGGGGGQGARLLRQQRGDERTWEAGNTSVRLMDWAESQRMMDSGVAIPTQGAQEEEEEERGDMPPRVPVWERFAVIIGSEVIYERAHAELVAAVVKRRLARGGCAVLQCAVREVKVFDYFAQECRRRGLRYRRRQVDPATAFSTSGGIGVGAAAGAAGGGCCPFEGILGRTDEYEGGVVLMALDHEDSPCAEWYRDDWEAVA